ncbi:8-oxo-dGTP diphosphatase MutT [Thalassotalea marina]|uniref:8-oxo-dGTP diphosphatase n=1 Tax=Thalassotalea marina TaxID=1673741 RepID=A0A919BBM9_9GAMM|nr:8-oxo-dGTP diphosphatase MutT [Thalassotalea marina]GHF79553.1 hypothetical protein GCM10017161_03410 [Thalassotalea marina]
MKQVHVAVGVIVSDQAVFLTRRHADVHQGGKWEFPGGKVESGESVAQALHRELQEEIAIDTLAGIPLIKIEHDYGDKQVILDVFIVDQYQGEPTAQEGQEEGWFMLTDLRDLDFPEANVKIIDALEQYYQ